MKFLGQPYEKIDITIKPISLAAKVLKNVDDCLKVLKDFDDLDVIKRYNIFRQIVLPRANYAPLVDVADKEQDERHAN